MLESLFNAAAGRRPATALKNMATAKVNVFFIEHLRIGNFQGKHLYRSPVPVKLKGMSCDFNKKGLYQERF